MINKMWLCCNYTCRRNLLGTEEPDSEQETVGHERSYESMLFPSVRGGLLMDAPLPDKPASL